VAQGHVLQAEKKSIRHDNCDNGRSAAGRWGTWFGAVLYFGGFQHRSQPQGGGWFGDDMFGPFQRPAPQPRLKSRQSLPSLREDFFEGQIRQLRSPDGVYFTRAGTLELAHYVEREITGVLTARAAPVALPIGPETPDASAIPGQAVRRPLVPGLPVK
jgi:hypothetical protein